MSKDDCRIEEGFCTYCISNQNRLVTNEKEIKVIYERIKAEEKTNAIRWENNNKEINKISKKVDQLFYLGIVAMGSLILMGLGLLGTLKI